MIAELIVAAGADVNARGSVRGLVERGVCMPLPTLFPPPGGRGDGSSQCTLTRASAPLACVVVPVVVCTEPAETTTVLLMMLPGASHARVSQDDDDVVAMLLQAAGASKS